ncbi:protein kinase domain-containing protein [Umezawaea sp. Da 62-37]|uniref:protein kinase domain-containing protein n=1 Tax=Umezawaea sp. Da 62-37 TaxID=3075927 RepID=UPI0028F6CCA1|nr:protein kinase [Umezawaea sp. Da 62-37]WNV83916.1 protein kinase [Umezawaea sp. Da 62-37]
MNQVFGNQYLLGAPIAGSAPGEVYAAHSAEADADGSPSTVAITLVDRRLATTPGVDAHLREQLAQVVRVDNPHLAAVRQVVRDGDRLGVVTDPLPPRTLRDLLDGGIRVLPAQVASLGAEIALALADLHAAHVLHLAVCPENVRLDGPSALLTGHGVEAARVALRRTARDEITTASPPYTAPEVSGDRAIGAGADVYSLGALLYEACCGSPPFTGTLAEVMRQHESMLPGAVPGMPSPLAGLIGRMLAKDSLSRPNATEVARQLSELALTLSGEPVVDGEPARPVPVPSALPSLGRFTIMPKRKKARTLLGVGLVAVVGSAVLAFSGDDGPKAQPPAPTTTLATTTTAAPTTSSSSTTSTPSVSGTTTTTTTTAPATATGPVTVQLDALKPVAGEWESRRPTGVVGVNGTDYPHSLTSDLGSCGGQKGSVEYNLMRNYLTLEGTFGLADDSRVKETEALVEVIVDDEHPFREQIRFGQPVPLKVDLTNALRLTIRWQLSGEASSCELADLVFGDPRLLGASGRGTTSGTSPTTTTR